MTATSEPARAAPEGVRVYDADWVDDARGRSVPSRLYWPDPSTTARSVPLIVFSHGLGNSRKSYSYLGERWSARGFASLHVQHVGSDGSVWLGNPFGLLDRIDRATGEREAVERARDLSFALDRLLDPGTTALAPLVDRRRIVAAGHSYGANTTLVVLGAKVVRAGRAMGHRDDRFKAGIVISAPPFYGEPDLAAVLEEVRAPTLHVTATEDVIDLPGHFSPASDRIDVFDAMPTSRKSLAVFRGGSHSVFTDRPVTGGIALNPRVKLATAEAAPAFLSLALEADATPLVEWGARWEPILAAVPKPFPVAPATRRRDRGRST